jgi:hypothetical protein
MIPKEDAVEPGNYPPHAQLAEARVPNDRAELDRSIETLGVWLALTLVAFAFMWVGFRGPPNPPLHPPHSTKFEKAAHQSPLGGIDRELHDSDPEASSPPIRVRIRRFVSGLTSKIGVGPGVGAFRIGSTA